jgi:hypothetical protein
MPGPLENSYRLLSPLSYGAIVSTGRGVFLCSIKGHYSATAI